MKRLPIILICVLLVFLSACHKNAEDVFQDESGDEHPQNMRTTLDTVVTMSFTAEEKKQVNRKNALTPADIRTIIGMDSFPYLAEERFSVAILDTGIFPHQAFQTSRTNILYAVDFVNGIESTYDDNGHGTAIAGIIVGIAPFVDIVSLKVLNYDCIGSVQDNIAAIDWAIENKDNYKIRLINVSVAMPVENTHFDKLSQAAERAYRNGIIVVASIGNASPYWRGNTITAPAVGAHTLAVGSALVFDLENGKMQFSVSDFSLGWSTDDVDFSPDLLALGENIVSLKSDIYYKGDGNPQKDTGYTRPLSGTSEAAAVISGAIANLMAIYPHYSNDQIIQTLFEHCRPIPGEKFRQGRGVFQFRKGS
jgi:serine protease AprX